MATSVKVKSGGNLQDGTSKGKIGYSVTKKKIESSSSKQAADSKQKSVQTVTKTEVKSKPNSASKTITRKTTTKVRERKVYTLAGQKFDPPEEREPLRIFYESLSKQIPTSEMAEFWMMEHGLLSPERSRKAYEKKQRKQKQLRLGTPIKSTPKPASKPESSQRPQPASKPESSQRPQQQASKNGDVKAKKIVIKESDDDDDDDFILSSKRRRA